MKGFNAVRGLTQVKGIDRDEQRRLIFCEEFHLVIKYSSSEKKTNVQFHKRKEKKVCLMLS
jgi:hypothetical protein